MLSVADKILQNFFGYKNFKKLQKDIIDHLVAGKNAMVIMPTGGGKSLCYQIPAIIRNGAGIVISPLVSLMQDQVEELIQQGISASCLHAGLESTTQYGIEKDLLYGKIQLLYVSPERILHSHFFNLLEKINIALFAIDEAHCISKWGHDFRPEYAKLGLLTKHFSEVPIVALTATADQKTCEDIIHCLAIPDAHCFSQSVDRPNIFYQIIRKTQPKKQLLNFILTNHAQHTGIVYCLSRRTVENITKWLNQNNIKALPYHAGLSAEIRNKNQQSFKNEEQIIMVATIAFGMGINRPDVRFVAHLDMPRSIEAYYQESGRAGRDGEPANSWMAYGINDINIQQNIVENSPIEIRHIEKQKLTAILNLCENVSCRRQSLLAWFGEKLNNPCNNCDLCCNNLQIIDATKLARMALSNIYRSGQLYGINRLIDILTGKTTEIILQTRQHLLSTFAIGKNISVTDWKLIYQKLLALGYIISSQHRGYMLTTKSKEILINKKTFLLQKEQPITPKITQTTKQSTLWQELRDCRQQLAKKKSIPPFMIFHDKTLHEMQLQLPQTLQEMANIHGIGKKKLEKYGKIFLKILTHTE